MLSSGEVHRYDFLAKKYLTRPSQGKHVAPYIYAWTAKYLKSVDTGTNKTTESDTDTDTDTDTHTDTYTEVEWTQSQSPKEAEPRATPTDGEEPVVESADWLEKLAREMQNGQLT